MLKNNSNLGSDTVDADKVINKQDEILCEKTLIQLLCKNFVFAKYNLKDQHIKY